MKKNVIFVLSALTFFISLVPQENVSATNNNYVIVDEIILPPRPNQPSCEYKVINNEIMITNCQITYESIPVEIDGYPVTKIGTGAVRFISDSENLVIPSGIKEIEYGAFCVEMGSGFKDITISKSVQKIGKYALGYIKIFQSDTGSSICGGAAGVGEGFENGHKYKYIKVENVVIRGYKGTAAETYAKENDIKFIALDEQPEVTTTAITQISTTTSTTVSTSLTTTLTQSSTSTSTTTTTSATTSSATSTNITTSTTISSQTTPVTSTTTTTSTTSTDITVNIVGDANYDGKLNIVDAAFIAQRVAQHKTDLLPACADYNKDGFCDIRDAAAIARDVARRKI